MYFKWAHSTAANSGGCLGVIRNHRGHKVALTAMVEPIRRAFVEAIERFAIDCNIPMVSFEKGQRKHDIAARMRKL